jgi:nucleotide-binding universal stress UspA family protein
MKTEKGKKVLIALDYNPTAQKVAEVGYSMAKAMQSKVILLHVMADPIYYSSTGYSTIMGFIGYMDMGPLQLDSVDLLKKVSLEFLEKTREHLGDESIQILLKDGDFAESIIEVAEDVHADIIVMGSHSRKWLENIVLGSVTEKVLHHSSIPLFIVPTKRQE